MPNYTSAPQKKKKSSGAILACVKGIFPVWDKTKEYSPLFSTLAHTSQLSSQEERFSILRHPPLYWNNCILSRENAIKLQFIICFMSEDSYLHLQVSRTDHICCHFLNLFCQVTCNRYKNHKESGRKLHKLTSQQFNLPITPFSLFISILLLYCV